MEDFVFSGELTRVPQMPESGKVVYCTLFTGEQDLELVAFRWRRKAFTSLARMNEGDIVHVRGTRQDDEFRGQLTRQLIVKEISLEKFEIESSIWDLENMPDQI